LKMVIIRRKQGTVSKGGKTQKRSVGCMDNREVEVVCRTGKRQQENPLYRGGLGARREKKKGTIDAEGGGGVQGGGV